MSVIFNLLSALIGIYSFLCMIRIVLSWIPTYSYSKPALFLAKICDPFLDIFRKIKFLRFQNIDFSPVVGFAVLTLFSSLFSNFALNKRISIGIILSTLLSMLWSLASSILTIIILLFIIRLIAGLIKKDTSPIFYSLDSTFRPITTFVQKLLFPNKVISTQKLNTFTCGFLIVTTIILRILFHLLIKAFSALPF